MEQAKQKQQKLLKARLMRLGSASYALVLDDFFLTELIKLLYYID